MRKALANVALVALEGFAAWAVESMIISEAGGRYQPWVLFTLVAGGLTTLAFWMPEIKLLVDPAARAYRSGVAKAEREKEQKVRDMIRYSLRFPGAGRPVYDATKGFVEVEWGRPNTMRHRVMGGATWLVNHGAIPKGIYLWFGRRLGYRYRDTRRAHPPESEGELSA